VSCELVIEQMKGTSELAAALAAVLNSKYVKATLTGAPRTSPLYSVRTVPVRVYAERLVIEGEAVARSAF